MDRVSSGAMLRGAYDAGRAAALSGVPKRTLHEWASNGLYAPSIVATTRTRLWSWGDLLALRAIDWFRRSKGDSLPPRVTIRRLREALAALDRQGLPRQRLHELLVESSGGELFVRADDGAPLERADRSAQVAIDGAFHVVAPYLGRGPDLLRPRPHISIVPGKLCGEPHLAGTRITSATLFALAKNGYTTDQMLAMYPEATPTVIGEAIDLERQLAA